jgi:RNA-binding protein NOB1
MAAAAPVPADPKPPVAKSWAALVDPIAASKTSPLDPTLDLPFAKMSLKPTKDDDFGGQFDDASEDEGDDDEPQNDATTEMELQLDFPSLLAASIVPYEGEDDEIDAGAVNETVSGKGADNHGKHPEENPHHKTRASVFMTEEEKQQNLKPISKSGRTYNSFRKYKGLMKPKQPKKKSESVEEEKDEETLPMQSANGEVATNTEFTNPQASRFLSGGGGGETMLEEDDDGQGWITSSGDIQFMKNEGGGRLDPGKTGTIGGNNDATNAKKKSSGPPISQRTACATTDFAMQNVLLQMNLILLSTDGMRIRRLKSWVLRCGACFKIHGADDDFRDETNHHMKRLFCSHCGSDMMQRISASVDGKTGRLKLHFSKRKQGRHHSIRGTKFSLPKPGSGNKYKGELLMREDQLLSGAWNQKVKINSGRKYQTSKSQSMFGRDIASSVGCNVKSTSSATFGGKGWATSANTSSMGGFGTNADDIRVGFGARKNPNAAKGRERRGKKKKSTDRACGMRRY